MLGSQICAALCQGNFTQGFRVESLLVKCMKGFSMLQGSPLPFLAQEWRSWCRKRNA